MMWLPLLLALGAPPQCAVNGLLPDAACTPGATIRISTSSLCTTKTSERRNMPASVRKRVFAEYGITPDAQAYEVDHLISLELGGSNDVTNLWPEAYPAAHDKDRLENTLHRQVCAGTMALDYAQHVISTDWVSEYHKEFGP
jgi:hypothetical protein